MKLIFYKAFILLLTITSLTFFGCKKKNNLQTINYGSTPKEIPSTVNIDENTVPDLDLSKMSATMVYAEVFNMLLEPQGYDRKILRIKGDFNAFIPNNKTERALTVIISDATACCQQGIEFKLTEPKQFPEDFPELGTEIMITGQFIYTQTEEGYDYFYLLTNKVEPLEI